MEDSSRPSSTSSIKGNVAPLQFRPAQVRLSLMESSRTSNGLSRKHVRHPRGTLINYILQDRIQVTIRRWAKSYSQPQNILAEAKYYKFLVHKQSSQTERKINRVYGKLHTVDNDTNDKNHILPLT